MHKKRYIPSALAAAVLAGLAVTAAALPASAATPDAVPAPQFMSVNYGGEVFAPDDHDTVSIGTTEETVFTLRTFAATTGTVTVTDEDGSTLCSTTILGGTTGIALCGADAPLSEGTHDVTATTTTADGTSGASEHLIVNAYADGSGGEPPVDPIVAQPNPGDTDTGFTPIVDPIVAQPNPGVTDPGFVSNGVAAPEVELGQAVGSMQQLKLTPPRIGNTGSGKINVYDASGAKIVDRSYDLGGSELSLYVSAPFGEKTVYEVEYVTSKGTSARTTVTIDRAAGTVDAPTFAFSPDVAGNRLIANLYGVAGAEVELRNSADGKVVAGAFDSSGRLQVIGAVVPNALNEYSITQTIGGVTSSALTHTVDTRTGTTPPAPADPAVQAPGEVDAGFSHIAEPVPAPVDPAVPAPDDPDAGFSPIDEAAAAPTTPRVVAGHLNAASSEAVLTVVTDVVEQGAKYIVRDESGVETELRIPRTESDFRVPVSHLGAQTFTVVKVVDGKRSAETTFRVDAA